MARRTDSKVLIANSTDGAKKEELNTSEARYIVRQPVERLNGCFKHLRQSYHSASAPSTSECGIITSDPTQVYTGKHQPPFISGGDICQWIRQSLPLAMPNVSIVMPLFNPDKKFLKKILTRLKSQKYKGKVQLIKVDRGLGLAASLNYGIKRAKYETVVSLHQDCIPTDKDWLATLVKPLEKKGVVAAVSDVELPFSLWNSFDSIAKILSAKEQRVITPGLDEKGCAYKKSALDKVGLFNDKLFRTAGEDFDLFIKLSKLGTIAYPHSKILHYHHYTRKSRLKKEYQLANGFGALVKIYGRAMPAWYVGMIKATPLVGFPLFLRGIFVKKVGFLSLFAPFLFFGVHLIYVFGFWKGFLMGRQVV